MRILTLISGAIFILAGIFCFANPGATILSLAFVLGCTMLFFGICGIMTYLYNRKLHEVSGWILEETIITLVLSVIVLSNQIVTDAVIPVFFGMWIMFSGIQRVAAAFALKEKDSRIWSFSLIFGALSVLGGIYAFVNPVMANLAMPILIGIFFLIQGLNTITTGLYMMKEDRLDEQH
jgi:membrane protein HdeD